jgi:hypothetical protein
LPGRRHGADEALQRVVSLVAKEEHQLPLCALELHLQAHLRRTDFAQLAYRTPSACPLCMQLNCWGFNAAFVPAAALTTDAFYA